MKKLIPQGSQSPKAPLAGPAHIGLYSTLQERSSADSITITVDNISRSVSGLLGGLSAGASGKLYIPHGDGYFKIFSAQEDNLFFPPYNPTMMIYWPTPASSETVAVINSNTAYIRNAKLYRICIKTFETLNIDLARKLSEKWGKCIFCLKRHKKIICRKEIPIIPNNTLEPLSDSEASEKIKLHVASDQDEWLNSSELEGLEELNREITTYLAMGFVMDPKQGGLRFVPPLRRSAKKPKASNAPSRSGSSFAQTPIISNSIHVSIVDGDYLVKRFPRDMENKLTQLRAVWDEDYGGWKVSRSQERVLLPLIDKLNKERKDYLAQSLSEDSESS